MAERREAAKMKSKRDQAQLEAEKRERLRAREEERRLQRAEAVERTLLKDMKRVLAADVLLEVLDARDPLGCRCLQLEAWAQEKGKRIIFVLAKSDCVSPQTIVHWLQAIGRVGPAVAVQAEAGREGVAELLRMLGKSPKGAASAPGVPEAVGSIPDVQSVGVIGYPSTGKKALCKALRQETKGASSWLLDVIGRLLPNGSAEASAAEALHCSMRGLQPKGAAWNAATSTASAGAAGGPLAAVDQLLERTTPAVIMRRFRLPAFASQQELLSAFAKERKLTNKKGKELAPEAVARRIIAELSSAPGCCCAPPAAQTPLAAEAAKIVFWPAHGEAVSVAMRAAMEAQASVLMPRDPGPCANALVMSSIGFGLPSTSLQLLNLTSLHLERRTWMMTNASPIVTTSRAMRRNLKERSRKRKTKAWRKTERLRILLRLVHIPFHAKRCGK